MAVRQMALMVNVMASSRASSLPQLIALFTRCVHDADLLVGASLLAMAVGQMALMVNVMASSRAGSLPQLSELFTWCVHDADLLVGASLLAMRPSHSTSCPP
jgi:hypothetical protein